MNFIAMIVSVYCYLLLGECWPSSCDAQASSLCPVRMPGLDYRMMRELVHTRFKQHWQHQPDGAAGIGPKRDVILRA
jgi:hypothetical protein